jgi:hypothetical protein
MTIVRTKVRPTHATKCAKGIIIWLLVIQAAGALKE